MKRERVEMEKERERGRELGDKEKGGTKRQNKVISREMDLQ